MKRIGKNVVEILCQKETVGILSRAVLGAMSNTSLAFGESRGREKNGRTSRIFDLSGCRSRKDGIQLNS
jgi:hypothetical protein